MSKRQWIALDVETSGTLPEYALQPWRFRQRKAWVSTLAWARRNTKTGKMITAGVTFPGKRDFRELLQKCIDTGTRVVAWNATFDIAWCIAYGCGDLVDKVMWLDGMLLWKHLDLTPSFATNHSYALKGEDGAVGRFCPEMLGYDDDVNYHDMSDENLAKLLEYNKHDTAATLIAAEAIWAKLDTGGYRRNTALTEAEFLPIAARANYDGMRIDRKATKALDGVLAKTIETYEARLAPFGVTQTMINSNKQLAEKVFDEWKLPMIKGRSCAKDILTELTIVDARMDMLMKYREALNLRSKFVGGIVSSCEYNSDRLTRPQCKVFGTYTSRCTYDSKQGKNKGERHVGFALHQMKRSKAFRSLIMAPEDYDLVEFDADGQEFRWMAILSGDTTMLGLCEIGQDPHSFMSSACYGHDYGPEFIAAAKIDGSPEKRQRQGGKVANLSLQFRTSAKTLRIRAKTDHNLDLSEADSLKIHKTYAKTYKGVPIYWSTQITKGHTLGYAETLAGRRIHIKGSWIGVHKWSMESTMINYPVQGTGGEQKYLALRVLKNHLAKYGARFAFDLHDGIYFYVPKAVSMKFAVEMKQVLDHLPYEKAWGFKSPIPLTWGPKVGPSWGELAEVH